LLGHLEFNVDECIAVYSKILDTVSIRSGNNLDAETVKLGLEKILSDYGVSASELIDYGETQRCKV
jgi:hypothetical protein